MKNVNTCLANFLKFIFGSGELLPSDHNPSIVNRRHQCCRRL